MKSSKLNDLTLLFIEREISGQFMDRLLSQGKKDGILIDFENML